MRKLIFSQTQFVDIDRTIVFSDLGCRPVNLPRCLAQSIGRPGIRKRSDRRVVNLCEEVSRSQLRVFDGLCQRIEWREGDMAALPFVENLLYDE